MKLYDRDFTNLTENEVVLWKEIRKKEKVIINGKPNDTIKKSLYKNYPTAVRHYLSLFPNNFLDPIELTSSSEALKDKIANFESLLNSSLTQEQDIARFIKEESAHFIIGAILKDNYRFGHHSAYLFPEFQMTTSFQADYLLVGRNSDGHHFVFVELENPYGKITIKDGSYGETIRKGVKQIDDWGFWLEENFTHLRPLFEASLNKNEVLPREFSIYDKTRIHYVVVAGRRPNYNKKTYRLSRNYHDQRKLQIFHYDNLLDFGKEIIDAHSY